MKGSRIPVNETQESALAEIEAVRACLESGTLDRIGLQSAMKAGAARNAIDCAFWDFEAKMAGKRVWELAGLPQPQPVTTAYTLSVASPAEMAATAARNAHRPLIKIKLTGEGDLDRVRAVREVLPRPRSLSMPTRVGKSRWSNASQPN